MKKFTLVIFSALFLGLLSCSTTKKEGSPIPKNNNVTYLNLADYLRQNTSVSISGEGQNVRLQIRGMNSFGGDTRPFIYVDKIPMGRGYSKANNAVNPNNIKRVEVISSLSRLAVYGEDGHSGVIKIHTKTNLTR